MLGLVGAGAALAALIAAVLTLVVAGPVASCSACPTRERSPPSGCRRCGRVAEVGMAVLTIGALLLAAFLVPPQRSGYLDVAGYRAASARPPRSAGPVAAALLVPLNVADALGRPVGDVLDAGLLARPGAAAVRGHGVDGDRR